MSKANKVVVPLSGERLAKAIGEENIKIWREPTFDHVHFSFDAAEKFSKDVGTFFTAHLKPEQK